MEQSKADVGVQLGAPAGPGYGLSNHPSHCPITGRPFFMTIQNEEGEWVATYGGPFDSYTIPEWNQDDFEFRSERYDHDADMWVEGGEPYSFVIVDEELLNQLPDKWRRHLVEMKRRGR